MVTQGKLIPIFPLFLKKSVDLRNGIRYTICGGAMEGGCFHVREFAKQTLCLKSERRRILSSDTTRGIRYQLPLRRIAGQVAAGIVAPIIVNTAANSEENN
jgi:hypothetical protein